MSVINKNAYIDFYNQEYVVFYAEQYDDGTRSITLTPKDGSEMISFSPDEWDAYIFYCKPDGKVCFDEITLNAESKFYIELTEQMLAVAGKSVAQLYLVKKEDGSIIQSTTFMVMVDEAIARDDIESASEFSSLNEMLRKIAEAYEQIENLAAKEQQINSIYNTAVNAVEKAATALDDANKAIEIAESINSTAAESAKDAAESADDASDYAESAKTYANNASTSASNAKTSETNAKTSETNASNSASSASTSASNASTSESNAKSYAEDAEESATNASSSATSASTSAENAEKSAKLAEEKADAITDYVNLSESYAHGNTGTRDNEDVDNAKYYYEQAKDISLGLQGILLPMGTITFSQLSTKDKVSGYMYNITDEFVTDDTFREGAGYTYPTGTNVYCTADGYWDCLAGTMVTGVKGDAETEYRKGNINLTPSDLGIGVLTNEDIDKILGN